MARTPRHTLTIVALSLGLAAAYVLIGATAAGASPGLTVGIAANQFIDAPEQARESVAPLNLGAVRVFLHWRGERNVTEADRWRLSQLAGTRSMISVYGEAADAPRTPAERGAYAAYVAQVVGLYHPWSVSVWNEPNLSHFWPQDGYAAEKYTRLLARTYDAVKRVDPLTMVCGGETVRSSDVVRWIKRMATRYKVSGRAKRRPLMDGFCHHPYPEPSSSATAGNVKNYPLWIVQGDVNRVRVALTNAFSGTKQRRWTPIYWTETGWHTGEGAYAIDAEKQGERMAEAVELAYCQKRVRGIFFFQLWDDRPGLGMWHTGILTDAFQPKPSFNALAVAIANVNAGTVNCARFPRGSL